MTRSLPGRCKEKYGTLGAIVFLLFLIYIAYSNTFQSPPVLDDFHSFVRNPSIYVEHWSYEAIGNLSRTFFGRARWIPMLTFALDYNIGKGQFVQFHITNLIIHMLAALAVFFFALQCVHLFRAKSKAGHVFKIYPAVWLAAIWALNPVQTNAVTYMVQRMASIQALFFTISVAFYLRGRRLHLGSCPTKRALLDHEREWPAEEVALVSLTSLPPPPKENESSREFAEQNYRSAAWVSYLLSLLAAICAFFSKENSAMLPVVIAVAEIWFFQPDGFNKLWRYLKKRHWVVWVAIGLVLVAGIMLVFVELESLIRGYRIRHFTPMQRLLTESRIVVWYMSLLLLPLPSRLCLEHDVTLSTSLLSPPTTLAAICFLLLCGYLIVRYRKRYPVITFGAAWFFLNLIIESTIVPLELVFEHRLYLPSIGFFTAFVFTLVRLAVVLREKFTAKEWLQLSWSAVAIVCAALTLMTFQRNEAWRNILTINADAVSKAPGLSRSHANYSSALLKAKKYDEAISEAEKAIKLGKPRLEDYVVAANNIVGAYMQQKRWREAAEHGDKFLRERPRDSDAMALPQLALRTADSHRRLGELKAAYKDTILAFDVMDQLPFIFPSVKRFAVSELQDILKKAADQDMDLNNDGEPDPGREPIDLWIADLFLRRKNYSDARLLLTGFLEKNRNNALAQQKLAALNREVKKNREQQGRWDFFAKYVKRPLSPFNMCMAVAYLVRKHRLPYPFKKLGFWLLSRANRLRPGDPDVPLLRGWYFYEDGSIDQALAEVNRAIELDPTYAKAWLAKGFFLADGGQNERAAEAFEKALRLYPGYPKRRIITGMIAKLRSEEGADGEAEKQRS